MTFMNHVECPNCKSEVAFPDDSEAKEECPWCETIIETGWGDCDDEDEEAKE